MEIELTKMETALILGGLGKKLKKTKEQQSKFSQNLEKGYYERFNSKQKRNIKKNKHYKIDVLNNLIEKFEKVITKEERLLFLSEMDFDYSELKCSEI